MWRFLQMCVIMGVETWICLRRCFCKVSFIILLQLFLPSNLQVMTNDASGPVKIKVVILYLHPTRCCVGSLIVEIMGSAFGAFVYHNIEVSNI